MNSCTRSSCADRFASFAIARRGRTLSLALGLAATLASPALLAKNGDLDTSFNGGLFLVWPGSSDPRSSEGTKVVVQSDGRVLGIGNVLHGVDRDWALVRRTGEGAVDTSFGSGSGQSFLSVGARRNGGSRFGGHYDAVIQPSGQIITVGSGMSKDHSTVKPHMIRWNTDGTVDTGFGHDGDVVEAMPNLVLFIAVAVQQDGKIIAAGSVQPGNGIADGALFRYTANGHADPTFGTGGYFKESDWIPTTEVGMPENLNVLPDGSIVFQADVLNSTHVEVLKLTKDGALDTSFGNGGIATPPIDAAVGIEAHVQPDGKIVGVASNTSSFIIYRLLGNGTLDTTFNHQGWNSINGIRAIASVSLPTGQVLVSGENLRSTAEHHLAVARFTTDGLLDNQFVNTHGSRGVVSDYSPALHTYSQVDNIAVQPDGRFVVIGYTGRPPGDQIMMARFQGDPLRLRPKAFTFTNVTGVPVSTVQVSDVVTIAQLTAAAKVPIEVVGGSYSINGNPFTTLLGYVKNGDQVMVEHTSAATSGTSVTTKLKVGGINDSNNPWLIRGTRTFATFTSTTQ